MDTATEAKIREVLGTLIERAMAPLDHRIERAGNLLHEIVQRIPGGIGALTGRAFVLSDDIERLASSLRSRMQAREDAAERTAQRVATLEARASDLEALRARVAVLETRKADEDQRHERFKEYLRSKARTRRRVDLRVTAEPIADGTPARVPSADPTTAALEARNDEIAVLRQALDTQTREHAETQTRLDAAIKGVSDGAIQAGRLEADIVHLSAQLKKEREQHAVTQKALERFESACADQMMQIMELRGEVLRLKDPDRDGERLRASAIREHARADDLRERLNEQEAMIKKWDAMIDEVTGPHREGETYADAAVRVIKELRSSRAASVAAFDKVARERDEAYHNLQGVMSVLEAANAQIDSLKPHVTVKDGQSVIEAAIEALGAPCNDCKALSDEIDRMQDVALTADADRIPLAMDLAILRSDIARMRPLVAAVQAWAPVMRAAWDDRANATLRPLIGEHTTRVLEAEREYEAACSAAADDDVCF